MSDDKKSISEPVRHKIVGGAVVAGVFALLGVGGYAGWQANDALNKPASAATISAVPTAVPATTSTTVPKT